MANRAPSPFPARRRPSSSSRPTTEHPTPCTSGADRCVPPSSFHATTESPPLELHSAGITSLLGHRSSDQPTPSLCRLSPPISHHERRQSDHLHHLAPSRPSLSTFAGVHHVQITPPLTELCPPRAHSPPVIGATSPVPTPRVHPPHHARRRVRLHDLHCLDNHPPPAPTNYATFAGGCPHSSPKFPRPLHRAHPLTPSAHGRQASLPRQSLHLHPAPAYRILIAVPFAACTVTSARQPSPLRPPPKLPTLTSAIIPADEPFHIPHAPSPAIDRACSGGRPCMHRLSTAHAPSAPPRRSPPMTPPWIASFTSYPSTDNSATAIRAHHPAILFVVALEQPPRCPPPIPSANHPRHRHTRYYHPSSRT